MGGSGGKRPGSKMKLMAKLGENLYKSTKAFRCAPNDPPPCDFPRAPSPRPDSDCARTSFASADRARRTRRRMLDATPKLKWERFLRNNSQQGALWKEWWDHPQSARWKKIPGQGLSRAELNAKDDAANS